MIYLYVCEECETEFEHEQKMKEDAPFCPVCGPPSATRRLIAGSTSFSLKGGGWFAQGYSKGD